MGWMVNSLAVAGAFLLAMFFGAVIVWVITGWGDDRAMDSRHYEHRMVDGFCVRCGIPRAALDNCGPSKCRR